MKPGDIVRLVWEKTGSDDDVLLVSIEPETDHNFPRLIEVLWKGVLVAGQQVHFHKHVLEPVNETHHR